MTRKNEGQWLVQESDDETIRFAETLARIFLERAGDEGKTFRDLLDRRDWIGLLEYTPRRDGITAEIYYALAQAQACFSKLEILPTGIDRRKVALTKFLEGEYRCGVFNRVFEKRSEGELFFSPSVEAVLHCSARKIDAILGPLPPLWETPLRFSPGGATTKTKKKDSDLRNLIADVAQCSEELLADLPRFAELLETLPHLDRFIPRGEDGSMCISVKAGVLNFVRKNAKTERGVTNECPLNKLVQNGYGDIMRDRLKRWGCDLQDDGRQKELAQIGSTIEGIATLDLTNASGLICLNLVRDQVPSDWLDMMLWCRTADIFISDLGRVKTLESFAGMGNGITFPLESLLFQAIAEAVCESIGLRFPIHSVYGDDIIISSEAVPLFKEVLDAIGLQINEGKSFVDGPFRESCGADWFDGYDVRPVFIRDNLSIESLYSLHNQFVRKGELDVAGIILNRIPLTHDKLWGPDLYGDGHLVCEDWHESARFVTKDGYYGWEFDTYQHIPKFNFTIEISDRVVPLVMCDAAYRSYLFSSVDEQLMRGLGRDKLGDFDAVLRSVLPLPYSNGTLKREGKRVVRPLLAAFAKSFEPPLLGTKKQTAKDRRRRNWKLRYSKKLKHKPHEDITVFGTPLPGSCGVRATTLYIFG
ncbi:TPA_asm: RNA-directed RNA polymerase [ssRNA phage SRR6960799_18]|uniref:RNA-directed RNA polymerase n=1 Tax=ssRNA phage SRR6960799_18 TaxID=2786574 RepID=A0A8S5KZB5_9VIRU|nr:RNA-directed RNA polymerase [ssRNA phage SRR6960799_18]DAD50648.1 TPA_asm: RNA-directed RNA polymerase [ssRNA phage SRR6960799_18]